ncbi:unnamed protein product [Prunus brigantina]
MERLAEWVELRSLQSGLDWKWLYGRLMTWNYTSIPVLLNCGSPESYSGDSEMSRHPCKFVEVFIYL